MRYLQGQFSLLDRSWQNGYSQEVKRSAAAFFILTGLFFAACLAIPSLRTMLVQQVYDLVGGMDVTDESGALSVGGLFINNLQACLMIMLYGLIPYVRLPGVGHGSQRHAAGRPGGAGAGVWTVVVVLFSGDPAPWSL